MDNCVIYFTLKCKRMPILIHLRISNLFPCAGSRQISRLLIIKKLKILICYETPPYLFLTIQLFVFSWHTACIFVTRCPLNRNRKATNDSKTPYQHGGSRHYLWNQFFSKHYPIQKLKDFAFTGRFKHKGLKAGSLSLIRSIRFIG